MKKHENAGKRIAGRRVMVPARMPEAERADLARALYQVHRRIFAGLSAEEFREEVVEAPEATATAIELYLSAGGDIVGYCAFHTYRRIARGRRVIAIRAQAGLLPDYRGRGSTYGFGMVRALIEKLKHPFTPVYYLGTLVHTSSYHLFCKYFARIYPHPSRRTPPEMIAIAREVIESFPAPAVSKDDPFLRDVHWTTIETPQERALNLQDHRRDVQFFRKRNPGYVMGHGLVVIVPITAGNLGAALIRRMAESLFIALGRRMPDL